MLPRNRRVLGRALTAAILWVLGGLAFLHPGLHAAGGNRLRVLVLSGKNNHAWQETTPALKKIFEDSRRFIVDVINDPSQCDVRELKRYDVIASNWTNFPSRDREWGTDAESAVLEFVRAGKGFVLFHAAGATFPNWPEYLDLAGASWGKDSGHGSYHAFNVAVANSRHAITSVIGDFTTSDELWHRLDVRPPAHVLCTAFSDQSQGGTGRWEPVAFTTNFGRGRGFYLVLGHDVRAMANPNWKLLMLRGTEWAATGKATIVVPFGIPTELQKAAGYERTESRERLVAIEELLQSTSRNPLLQKELGRCLAEALQSGATPDFKKFICEQLSFVGTPAEVPVLAKFLGDDELGFAARAALERMPGESVSAALREAAGRLSGRPLIGVINLLGEREDSRAVGFLRRYLEAGADEDAASAAIQALGKIGGSVAAKVLSVGENSIPARLRPLVADSLLRIAGGFEAAGKSEEAGKLYEKLKATTPELRVRAAAFLGLVRCAGSGSDRVLVGALGGGDMAVQAGVIRYLRTPQGRRLAASVASRIVDFSETLHPQLIYALADAGDARVLPQILGYFSTGSKELRLAATYATGRLGDSSSIETLIGAIQGAGPEELAAIRESLARLNGRDVDERLIAGLAKPAEPAVKRELIIALAARGSARAGPALLSLADDQNSQVRRAALKALGSLGGLEIGETIIHLLGREGLEDDRSLIESALINIGRRGPTADPLLDILIAKLPASEPGMKESFFKILGGLGGDRAFQAVRGYLKDEKEEDYNSAIRALSAWPDAAPLGDLLSIARSEKTPVPKILALRGVAGLVEKSQILKPEEKAEIIAEALVLAADVETTKALISVLAKQASVGALETAVKYLDQPGVSGESGIAVAEISRAVGKEHPAAAHGALLAAARGAATPNIAGRLRSVLAELGFPPPSPRIKVAIITGGHEFDPVPFFAMFRSFEEVEFTHLPQADDSEAFEDIDGWPYDVIVFYNMTQNIPARRRANLLRLLEDGVGVLALHHASGAYQPWPDFKKIIGCRYNVTASETGGEKHRPSSFRHDVDIPVRVADSSHSVSRGLVDFIVHDETYKACEFESTNRVLLTTDEPSSDKPLCMVRNYRRANVCYIQLGHGPGIFSQEMFRKLVGQALSWCAKPKGQGGERREADRKTDQR